MGDTFVTALAAELDRRTGLLRWVTAGHPRPVGIGNGSVLPYTDGVVEARSPEGEEFGLDRLMDLLIRESASGLLAGEVLRRLVHTCLELQGGRLRDDATLLLEWSGPSLQVVPQRQP